MSSIGYQTTFTIITYFSIHWRILLSLIILFQYLYYLRILSSIQGSFLELSYINSINTESYTVGSAPLSRSNLTTSNNPLYAAIIRAVHPLYYSIKQLRIYVILLIHITAHRNQYLYHIDLILPTGQKQCSLPRLKIIKL